MSVQIQTFEEVNLNLAGLEPTLNQIAAYNESQKSNVAMIYLNEGKVTAKSGYKVLVESRFRSMYPGQPWLN